MKSAVRRTAYSFGRNAECSASDFLASQGYCILKTRYRRPCGEVDLIAKRNDHIAFVEVKARRTVDEAAWSILPHQRQRIQEAASAFLADHPDLSDCSASFDVVLVSRSHDVVHIPGAFLAE